ncbi:MAG TPA: Crp/Fnr family transcriptional regulator [Rhodanobacteraceae bacterium]|nr:Crp/Fnr family transcriptional regulator [Rhodanobacteraceae bacterium]
MHREDDALRAHYLLAGITDTQWRALAPHLHRRHLAAGQILFSQGDRADAFFIVSSGAMKLFRVSAQGAEKIMRLVRGGQSFAESILFSDPPRYPVHAQAAEDSELVAIEREAYLRILRESFETCRAVMAQMTQRIQAHWNEIEALSLHGAVPRVARYLLEQLALQGRPEQLRLPAAKTQIAAQLGLAPETLSRGLRTLSENGAINVRGALVQVRDEQELRRATQV